MAATQGPKRFKHIFRKLLTAPHLAAVLPASMILANWWGGQNLMLLIAIVLPGSIAIGGLLTQPNHTDLGLVDMTTGLPTRSRLLKSLDQGFSGEADSEKTCLIVEIDDFHQIEGQFGEAAKDRVVEHLADALRSVLRQSDLICVLSEDRFGVAMDRQKRTDLEATLQVAARMQDAISDPISVDQARVTLSASIGFCLPSRTPEKTGEAILSAAESALNNALSSGPGSIRAFTQSMKSRQPNAFHSAEELSNALDDGQFQPWFQPQISTDTAQLTGLEALARWRHPENGLIAPGAFLPALRQAGLLERLSEVMIFETLGAIRNWDRQGLDIPTVAVNFSTEELSNPKLSEKIHWELDRFDVAPERLTIEILESVVAQPDDDVIIRNINALSQLGCNIDLDDFGTGHASIVAIQRFKVNRIKIDRSFVTHVDTDPDQQAMVAAILTMAGQLKVGTVAEGVESHGEHTILAQLGCDHVQGYAIANPMPKEACTNWIREAEARSGNMSVFPRQA